MTQQNLTIGTQDAKAGDNLFDAFTKTEANFTDLYTLVAANLASIGGLTSTYWFDANDLTTATTAISHTGGATTTYLTNDAAGSFTNEYNPDSKDNIWDDSTNQFDFSSLKIGDVVEFRGDIEVDTSAVNQEFDILMSLGEGGSPYDLNISHSYYKSVATGNKVTFVFRIYMGDTNTLNNPARFRFESTDDADIKVNGWFSTVTVV